VSIDLLVGYDRFEIQGYKPIQSLTYGGLLGLRATWMDYPIAGLAPYIGIGAGPTLSYVFTGAEGQTVERLLTGIAGMAGVTYRFSHRVGINLEYRFLYGRSAWLTSGLNVGGSWLSVGIVLYLPSGPSPASRMSMN
jgi:opacity protein-like surface antigen